MAVTFGSWLKQRRKERGIAQEELADRIGCSEAMLRKLESGERHPSGQMARLLAEYLGVPEDEREAFVAFARTGQSTSSLAAPTTSDPQSEEISSASAPWRTSYRRLTNLPSSLTPLIGREAQIVAARTHLLSPRTRLLTLTGAPGIGKTRLALELAAGMLPYFEDGVFFVDLAPISEPPLVLPAVARALGLADEGKGGVPVEHILLNYLRDKRLLLVLDNFEQVLDAAYHLTTLLEGSPWLRVLATSREPLRVKGERRFPVPPLSLPASHNLPPAGELARYSSVELFVERVRMSEPDFALSGQDAHSVASICIHLDGLPLAIELAAGQVGLLSPQEIEERLTTRLELLEAREQHLPERQRSLRGAIDSSHNLLGEEEKRLFRRLGVFRGGFRLEAVKAVCSEPATPANAAAPHDDGLAPDAAQILQRLLDKNLVSQMESARAERRFAMLETIREYALERLYESGEAGTAGERHAEYYLSIAQEGAANLRGPEQGRWLNALQTEHDNMNAALEMLFTQERRTGKDGESRKEGIERVEMGARLCVALYPFWEMRSYLNEGRRWFREAIDRLEATARPAAAEPGGASTSEQAHIPAMGGQPSELYSLLGTMYSGAGNYAFFQSNFGEAQTLHTASLAIRRQLGDKWGIASSLGNLGNAAMYQGDYPLARRYHTENLSLARELENGSKISTALNNLSIVECDEGNFSQARGLDEEALAIAEKLGDADQMARVLNNLGIVMRYQGDYADARKVLTRALDLQSELEMKHDRGFTLVNLGFVARDEGEYVEARRYFLEGLAAVWEAGDSRVAAECLEGLASLEVATGDARRAAFLFGCADAARDAIQAPITPAEHKYHQASVEQARARLDQLTWSEAWSKGRAISLDKLVAQLLGRLPRDN